MQKKRDEKKLMRLIEAAKYSVKEMDKMEKRRVGCIDDRAKNFPAGRMAGGDFGQAAAIIAAANSLGVQIKPKEVIATIAEYVGGEEKLHIHTDTHSSADKPMGGCGYVQKVLEDPGQFGLTAGQAEEIYDLFTQSQAEQAVVDGPHAAAAFVIVESESHGLHSSHLRVRDPKQVFVYHQTLVDKRQEDLSRLLVEKGIIQLPLGTTEKKFTELLKQKIIRHFILTRNKLAPHLPIRRAKISSAGNVQIKLV